MKIDFSSALKSTSKFLVKRSPEIFIGLGISGFISSAFIINKVSVKAHTIMEEKKKAENKEELTIKEKIKTVGKYYILPITLMAASSVCLCSSVKISSKRNAALAALCSLSEDALMEYKNKVVETIGKEKESIIHESVVEDRMTNDPVTDKEVIILGKPTYLCYDMLSKRYFKSNEQDIKDARDIINKRIFSDNSASLNEFYDELGLDEVDFGYDYGWEINRGLLELSFSTKPASDGTPCLVIDYVNPPRRDYDL